MRRYGYNICPPNWNRNPREDGYHYAGLAVSLDPMIGMTHVALAGLQIIDKRFEEALASAERAVALEPSPEDRLSGAQLDKLISG